MDTIIKQITNNNNFEIVIIDATKIIKKIQSKLKLDYKEIYLLGNLIINTLLLANEVNKNKYKIIIEFKNKNNKIVSEIINNNSIRGYIKSDIDNINWEIFENGYFNINKQLENGDFYKSKLDIIKGDINDQFNNYMRQSEQILSKQKAYIDIKDNKIISATGYGIIMLPNNNKNNDDEIILIDEKLNDIQQNISKKENFRYNKDIKKISESTIKIIDNKDKNYYLKLLNMLTQEELESIFNENEIIKIEDDFSDEIISINKLEI